MCRKMYVPSKIKIVKIRINQAIIETVHNTVRSGSFQFIDGYLERWI